METKDPLDILASLQSAWLKLFLVLEQSWQQQNLFKLQWILCWVILWLFCIPWSQILLLTETPPHFFFYLSPCLSEDSFALSFSCYHCWLFEILTSCSSSFPNRRISMWPHCSHWNLTLPHPDLLEVLLTDPELTILVDGSYLLTLEGTFQPLECHYRFPEPHKYESQPDTKSFQVTEFIPDSGTHDSHKGLHFS